MRLSLLEGVLDSAATTGEGRQTRRFLILLLCFLTLSFFTFGTYKNWPYKVESDGKYYYQFLVSGFYDHDFDFANNYRVPKPARMRMEIDHYNLRYAVDPITGKPKNLWTIGPALLWLPFFTVAVGCATVLLACGVSVDPNPWGTYFQYFTMFAAVIYTTITAHLLSRLLARHFATETSRTAVWVILVSTNWYYYTVFEPSLSHVYDLFTFVAYLAVFDLCSRRRRLLDYLGLAALGGLHVLVRTQNIVPIGLFSALLAVRTLSQRDRRSLQLLLGYATALLVALSPLLLTNISLSGRPFAVAQGQQFFDFTHPKVVEVLFSFRNGLFSHHPVLLLGAMGYFGFFMHVKRSGDRQPTALLLALAIAFALQTYVNSIALDWWSGHSFGQRRLMSSYPLFTYGIAYMIQRGQASFQKLTGFALVAFSASGLLLTGIHVFLWSYDQPHNIAAWLFYHAPLAIGRYLTRF